MYVCVYTYIIFIIFQNRDKKNERSFKQIIQTDRDNDSIWGFIFKRKQLFKKLLYSIVIKRPFNCHIVMLLCVCQCFLFLWIWRENHRYKRTDFSVFCKYFRHIVGNLVRKLIYIIYILYQVTRQKWQPLSIGLVKYAN